LDFVPPGFDFVPPDFDFVPGGFDFLPTDFEFLPSRRLERGAASTRFGVAALQRNVLLLQQPRAASAKPPRRPRAGGASLLGCRASSE